MSAVFAASYIGSSICIPITRGNCIPIERGWICIISHDREGGILVQVVKLMKVYSSYNFSNCISIQIFFKDKLFNQMY